MDNAILILAGEAIDVYLGAALGLSTMCVPDLFLSMIWPSAN
jgi:hypothetical protein